MDQHLRNWIPFFFAQEQAYRRMGRLLETDPGAFRRFQIIDNGTRIATADGAWEVQTARVGAELEVRVADDAYRFPAAPEAPVANASAR